MSLKEVPSRLFSEAAQPSSTDGIHVEVTKSLLTGIRKTYGKLLSEALTAGSGTKVILVQQIETASDWFKYQRALLGLENEKTLYLALVLAHGVSQQDCQTEIQSDVQILESEFSGNWCDAVAEASGANESKVLWLTCPLQALDEQPVASLVKPVQQQRSMVSVEVAREDRKAIWNKSFSSNARRWISLYETVGSRDLYLWQWCLHGIEMTTFPTVPDESVQEIYDTKLLSVILCVLFDDVADQPNNACWLDTLIASVREPFFRNGNMEHQEHIRITTKLWREYECRVQDLPGYSKLERVWKFDIEQFLTAMEYGQLMNQLPELANPTEQDVYTPHNMLMVSFGTLDLMASLEVPMSEYGMVREAMWHAQAMGRVGNVLSTWRRELSERDLSNGIVAKALAEGILTREELQHASIEDLKQTLTLAGYQDDFMEKWNRHRRICHRAAEKVSSINLIPVLEAHDRFLEMHLGCVGLI